ncbi:proline iminopeptidase-family hydrolase [Chloroflexota bacterium]
MNNNSKTDDIREGYISVTGGKVWYRIVGANEKGITLLTLHGGPGAPHDLLEPLEGLADERPVVFYDQLGCGNSDKPDDTSLWTIERFVEELGQVRAALGLEKVHILGQSWGTMLATDYMLTKPEGVVSLVFSGPALSASRFTQDTRAYLSELPEDVQKTIRESEANGDFGSEEYQDAMMLFYRLHLCRVEPWPDYMNRTFEKLGHSVYEYMWGASEFTVTGTLKDYERVDRLKEITIPVLFTCGRYDEATPATTKFYQSNLPGSEVAILEDASHAHHIEKTEEYLQVVRDFLRRAESHSSD